MGMQKKTKIALLAMVISAIVLTGVILLLARSGDNTPVDIVQGNDEPDVTITPTPTLEEAAIVNEDPVVTVSEEPKGLTNGQKYFEPLVEKGSKNILVIGRDATYGAYDFIVVASMDEKSKSMKLINFPRDVYIDYNSKILKQLKEADPEKAADHSIQKLNAAHAIGISLKYKSDTGGKFGKTGSTIYSMNFWADLLDEVFDIQIDDYIIVQVEGFREIIDYFGGVKIDVPIYMHYEDPVQNLYIHLEPGSQVLYGEQAEGFVRFRQGYTEDGEFKTYSVYSRQKNQNAFLKAFFEQHVNLSNLGKLKDVAEIVAKNVKTSVNDWSEIVQYSNAIQKALRGKYKKEDVIVKCLENPKTINGSIYEILRTE